MVVLVSLALGNRAGNRSGVSCVLQFVQEALQLNSSRWNPLERLLIASALGDSRWKACWLHLLLQNWSKLVWTVSVPGDSAGKRVS